MTRGTIVVFARAPVLGRPKTRLAQRWGAAAALRMHRAFLGDTLENARAAGAWVVLAHTPERTNFDEQALADAVVVQRGRTFGERMDHTFERVSEDYGDGQPLLLIGSDTPHLPTSRLRDALDRLRKTGAVVGPASRGGFYLLGFSQNPVPVRSVFRSRQQARALVRHLSHAGLTTELLPPWYDLDTPGDVLRLRRELLAHQASFRDWQPERTGRLLRSRLPPSPPQQPAGAPSERQEDGKGLVPRRPKRVWGMGRSSGMRSE